MRSWRASPRWRRSSNAISERAERCEPHTHAPSWRNFAHAPAPAQARSGMLDANLKPQTWLRRKLFSLRLRPWRLANNNRTTAALLCTTLTVCLLCCSKERVPEIVPSGGRNRPRLPWLRKRPARRAPLNVASVASGASCTNVATGAELAVDHRGVLCACAAPAHSPTEARYRPCPDC